MLGCECASAVQDVAIAYHLLSEDEKVDFWRGCFDTNGTIIKSPNQDVKVSLVIKDDKLVECFTSYTDIVCDKYTSSTIVGATEFLYSGTNAIEFIARIYRQQSTQDINFEPTSNYLRYKQLMYCWTPTHTAQADVSFKFQRTRYDAIAPHKAHVTDSGYDLWLLEKVKEENGMVMYDTGIAVKPPHGFYFELVGRSSISKSGYIMANSVGIIDASYRGSLKVALIKINRDIPDLELPCRLVQLIPRQFVHLEAQEVEELDSTARGEGGFGSSG